MLKSFNNFLSASGKNMKRSAIREIRYEGSPRKMMCEPETIFQKAIGRNVAFVSDSTFFCNDSGHNTMRINFSFSDPVEIDEGVRRLSKVIREELNGN